MTATIKTKAAHAGGQAAFVATLANGSAAILPSRFKKRSKEFVVFPAVWTLSDACNALSSRGGHND